MIKNRNLCIALIQKIFDKKHSTALESIYNYQSSFICQFNSFESWDLICGDVDDHLLYICVTD